ncbi:MAG: hypothetical protein FWC97_06355 [Treponema sp.]|nr:hypothetical protein [Treponema sp.]
METKKNYAVLFLLVFIMCLSVFLFSATSHRWSAERVGLDHAFTGLELTRLFGRHVSSIETGIINAVWRLFLWGSFGVLAVHLSLKTGFKNILNDEIKKTKVIITTILVGFLMGLFFIGYQTVSARSFGNILKYAYSQIPASMFSSIAEGIGCQIVNMFTVIFLMWLFSKTAKTEEGQTKLFWRVAVICALIFSIRHIDSTMLFYSGSARNIFDLPFEDYLVIIGLYAPLSLVCTFFLRKYGLLSAIGIHFISDIMWRIGWAYIRFGELIFRW